MMPPFAAAQPCEEFGKAAALIACVVPEVCVDQVVPPLVVASTVVAPTAKQWEVSVQEIEFSVAVDPDTCAVHNVPPFVVATTVPDAPSAQHAEVLAQDRPLRPFVVVDVW